MSLTPQQLAEAMAVAARDTYRPPPPWMYSTLRPVAPPKPLTPPTLPTTEIVGTAVPTPPVASEVPAEVPAAPDSTVAGATVAEVVPTWEALLDLRVWRSRLWWWRLAASLIVKRLNR